MTEQGVCPVCGSLNIDYGHIEEHNDIDSEVATEAGVYYPSTCLDLVASSRKFTSLNMQAQKSREQ